ncbi:MAG: hypothetical protein QM811_16370 [Pirellulales bacterium]
MPFERHEKSKMLAVTYRLVRFLLVTLVVWGATDFAHAGVGAYLKKPDAWFAGDEAERIAANVLSHQSESGGWPKNVDTTAAPYADDRAS